MVLNTASTTELWETVREALGTDLGLAEMDKPQAALDSLRSHMEQLEQTRAEADANGLRLAAEVERLEQERDYFRKQAGDEFDWRVKAEQERDEARAALKEIAFVYPKSERAWVLATEALDQEAQP
jgi:chromosome segregation ATPase